MNPTKQPKQLSWRRIVMMITLSLVSLCLVVLGISYLSNQFLPEPSDTPDQLTREDLARAEEALNLMASLGHKIWPGLDDSNPLIIWNESYAFLINSNEQFQGWERVENVSINKLPVYVQENTANYQAFAEVLVKNRYAGSIATKNVTNIKFIDLFKENLPPVISQVLPYQLILLSSDHYITALVHETFHAYQAENFSEKFKDAENAYKTGDAYESIFPEMSEAWQSEVQILINAVQEGNRTEKTKLVKEFLQTREERRAQTGLTPNLVLYENRFEWLEGSAKYVELEIWKLAAESPTYQPVKNITDDKDFKAYKTYDRHWKTELSSMKNAAKSGGDTLFYYSGMMQARLLDDLLPDWQSRISEPDVWYEDLLREAVQ